MHWKESDIIPGRLVCRPVMEGYTIGGSFAKWAKKIGYQYSVAGQQLCLIAMSDGLVSNIGTAEELAATLNQQKLVPMREDWLPKLMAYLSLTHMLAPAPKTRLALHVQPDGKLSSQFKWTIGKYYHIVERDGGCFHVPDDDGRVTTIHWSRFVPPGKTFDSADDLIKELAQ